MIPIWKVPWYCAFPTGAFSESLDPPSTVRIDAIVFQLEFASTLLNWDYTDGYGRPGPKKFPHRYRCLSCQLASGASNDIFRTQCEQAQHLKEGPTDGQQQQMIEHAQQHSIMWSWARRLK